MISRSRRFAAPSAACALLSACSGAPEPTTAPTTEIMTTVTATPAPEPSAGAAAARGWDAVFAEAQDAVVRLSVTTCDDGASMGSGFLADGVVVTAAHVVSNAQIVSLQTDDGTVSEASVVGVDPEHDVAVLRADGLEGNAELTFAEDVPDRGSVLAALGYPLRTYDLRISTGIVAGLPEAVAYDDQLVERAFISTADTNPGNSGGPVLDSTGEVIGLVSGGLDAVVSGDETTVVQGVHYVIPVQDIRDAVDRFASSPPMSTSCSDLTEGLDPPPASVLDVELSLTVSSDDPLADPVGQVLFTHGSAINNGDHPAAFELFTAREREELGGLEGWRDGVISSRWIDIDVVDVESLEDPRSSLRADVVLRTVDLDSEGYVGRCTLWRLTYEMKESGSGLLIDKVRGDSGSCD